MAHLTPEKRCRCTGSLSIFSHAHLLLYLILSVPSYAQLTSSGISTTPSTAQRPTQPTTTPTSSRTSAPSLTLLTGSSTPTMLIPSDASPSSSSDPVPTPLPDDQRTGLLNYYFVFLFLLILLLFSGAWVLHKRKKRLKARSQSRGRSALARDLDGWVVTDRRAWMYGSWRSRGRDDDEGLNELGEAPPPYAPAGQGEAGVAVPLRTFSRGSRASFKPPDYRETVREVGGDGSRRPDEGEGLAGTDVGERRGSLERGAGRTEGV